MGKSVYLCGSISHEKDLGNSWRRDVIKWAKKYKVTTCSPLDDECNLHKKYKLKTSVADWESFPNPLGVAIIKKDMDKIRFDTRYVICYFTKYSTGTVSELSQAVYHDIPVYMVTKMKKLKGWPKTAVERDNSKKFKSFDELQNFLVVKYGLKRK
jgi:hypothetical protein